MLPITWSAAAGFRIFRLAPSTFQRWTPPETADPEALKQQISFFDDGLKDGADPLHVVYEVILKEGYSLTSEMETLAIGDSTVYRITDEALLSQVPAELAGEPTTSEPPSYYLCIDDTITDATLDALPLDEETVFICQDRALTDSQKVNLSLQCVLKTI